MPDWFWEVIHKLNDLSGIATFLLTVVLVVIAVRPANGVTPTERRPSSANSIFTRRRLAAFFAVIFGVITIYLILTHPGGTQGPKGETGPAGPAGPPGLGVSPVFTEAVKALANIRRIEKASKQLTTLRTQFDEATKDHLQRILSQPAPENSTALGLARATEMTKMGIQGQANAIQQIESQIKTMASQEGESLDFGKHPRFDDNQYYQSQDADRAATPEFKMDYRRLSDQYNNDAQQIDHLSKKYQTELSAYDQALNTLGR